jgi:hypothetical protein
MDEPRLIPQGITSMQTFNERCADAMNAPPEYVSEYIDCLTKTCPNCGALAEIPDCRGCGYVFGTALPAKIDSNLKLAIAGKIHGVSDTDLIPYTPTRAEFLAKLGSPEIGKKDGVYFIRCSGSKRTNNDTSNTADILIIDADSRIDLNTGKVVSGAVAAELAHQVLINLGINHCICSSFSNGEHGADYHKYRVIIFCRYTREQLPFLLNWLFEQLHSNEVMLAPVKENLTWPQPWYYPRVPDEQRKALFKFFQFTDGIDLDAVATHQVWLKEHPPTPTAKPELLPTTLPLPKQYAIDSSNGRRDPIKEFNATHEVWDIIEHNGYEAKPTYDMRWLCSLSVSKEAGVQLATNCVDGVMRVYSHHGSDPLNDGFAHDAFDCYRILECGGDWAKANDWNPEITAHNRKIWSKEQLAKSKDKFSPTGVGNSQGHTDNENVIRSQSATVPTTQPEKSTFKTLSLRELLNRKYVTNWLVKGVIERGNLALFFGDSASGKTFYIMDMCFCIAAGIDFKGKATKQGNVLYICGEGFSGLQKRFMALYQHYGVMPENLHLSERPAALMDIASALAVMRKIEEIGNVSLIVIDTFHRNMGGGSEDSAEDIGEFLKNVDGFLKPTGAAVAIIHHSGHGEKGRSRGSSAIRAAMDVEYQVTKDQLTNRVTVTNTKMKDWQAPPPACFSMNVVNLLDDDNQPISDEDGELLTSVILESAEPATSRGKALTSRQQAVLTELHKAIEKHGTPPTDDIKNLFPDSPQNIPDKVVHSDKWRELTYKVIDSETQKLRNQAFNRAKTDLKNLCKIGFYDGFVWLTYKPIS